MFRGRLAVIAVVPFLVASTPLAAQEAQKAKVGMLTCQTSASIGLIVGSHQRLRCRFAPDNGGPQEYYSGHVGRIGLDVGIRAAGVLAWAVYAPSKSIHYGSLAGTYVGASGDISLGIGVGAKALVGGSHNSVALQPISLEGQVGINVALSISSLKLSAQ